MFTRIKGWHFVAAGVAAALVYVLTERYANRALDRIEKSMGGMKEMRNGSA